MASIFSLPPEILSEIATFVAHEDFAPPIRLLLTSKTWSEIVLNTPSAFSALSIECSLDPSDPCIEVISRWIERSGISPLFITLDLRLTDHTAVPFLLPGSPLHKRHEHIRELHIHHPSAWNLWNLDHLWPAPSLRSLFIVHDDASVFEAHLELIEFPLFLRNTMQAPQLRTLKLNHCRFDKPASDLPALEELEASSCVASTHGLRGMLLSCRHLQRLVLKDFSIEDGYTSILTGAHLQEIRLDYTWSIKLHVHSPLWILQGISTPALTHLTLSCANLSQESLEYMHRFIGQTHIQLRYLGLTLIGAHLPSSIVLPELVHLETLHIIVRNLYYHPRAVLRHPSLTEFKLRYEPRPSNIVEWEELFSHDDRFSVECSLFNDAGLIEGHRKSK